MSFQIQIKSEKNDQETVQELPVSGDNIDNCSTKNITQIEQFVSKIDLKNQNQKSSQDVIVKEIDIYLAKSLSNKIFVLQFPTRPSTRNYDDAKILNTRIKPKKPKIELEFDLDTTSGNYSRVKGEQFAINVDGSLSGVNPRSKPADQAQRSKYFHSNIMDKVVLTSSNACLGQMNRLYHLGFIQGNKDLSIHITSIYGILQMKPSFEYFDLAERRLKDQSGSGNHQDDSTAYSTEEEPDSEIDSKPELVTLKYGVAGPAAHSTIEDQNWINAKFLRIGNENLKESLICKHINTHLKVDLSNEELIKKSMDFNSILIDNEQSEKT